MADSVGEAAPTGLHRYLEEPAAGGRTTAYLVVSAALVLGFLMVRGSTWQSGAQLHTVMEAVATILALIVGGMALARFYSRKSNTFLFVGAAFLGTSFLDGFHAVVTSEFFSPLLPSDLPSLIPWSWVASRLFLSVLLFLSWAAWRREKRLGDSGRVSESIVYLSVAVMTAACFALFALVPLPRAYYPELPFPRPEEFLPALFFLLALVGYLRKGDWRTDIFEHWLVLSLIIGFLSQAMFMSTSGQVFDAGFDLAHLLKKVSYVLVLMGLLLSMLTIFWREERANADLRLEVRERKLAKRALLHRAEELARSNQDLEQFAYIASHDLKEPLRKVQAFSGRLKSKYADKLGEEGRNYIERMESAAERMQALIDSLLTFSRVATKGKPFEPTDLNEIVADVVSDLEVIIRETNAEIEVESLPNIDGDPVQLRQLVQNIIGNALMYRQPDVSPRINISSDVQDDVVDGSTARCRLRVRDNGIGFEQQYSERIFEIFQRLHGRTTYSGEGMGLSIARKIAERHGGTIAAKSKLGAGSTFTITLPLNHN